MEGSGVGDGVGSCWDFSSDFVGSGLMNAGAENPVWEKFLE